MKRTSFFSFLAAGVIVLLLTGIGGFFWLVRSSPLLIGGSNHVPAAAMFVPSQAPVMVSVLVPKLEAGNRQSRDRPINQLKTSLLSGTDLDYDRDVKPWLGDEITISVTNTDIDRDSSNGRQTGYLMALATKDATKSREFLQLLFSQRAIAPTDLVYEQYKGVKLIYDNSVRAETPNTLSAANSPAFQKAGDNRRAEQPKLSMRSPQRNLLVGAVVGDRFVLFANNPKVLRDAINNVEVPELNLTSSRQYQQALSLLPRDRIGVTYLNLPSLNKWLGNESAPKTYQNQIIALELNSQGLLAETNLIAAPNQEIAPPAPNLPKAAAALQYLPTATGLAISGFDLSRLQTTNLHQLWTQIADGASDSGYDIISRLVTQPLASIQTRWGIDLPKDIFSWVQGQYALGLLPHNDGTPADWIFVAEKSDAATDGISRLDAIASLQGFSISSLTLENHKISAWTQLTTDSTKSADPDGESLTLKAKVQGVRAEIGNYEIFTTSVEAMDEALKADQIGSLMNSPKFRDAIAPIEQPNEGYLYVDWRATQPILERQLPALKLVEALAQPLFSNLRSLTVSSYDSEPGTLKGSLFFKLVDSQPNKK